jgi:hypothetical protein
MSCIESIDRSLSELIHMGPEQERDGNINGPERILSRQEWRVNGPSGAPLKGLDMANIPLS